MKARNCSICGDEAVVVYLDNKGRGTLYGIECDRGDHSIGTVFETKNRAVRAWNECQEFVERYTEEKE